MPPHRQQVTFSAAGRNDDAGCSFCTLAPFGHERSSSFGALRNPLTVATTVVVLSDLGGSGGFGREALALALPLGCQGAGFRTCGPGFFVRAQHLVLIILGPPDMMWLWIAER